ncbi:YncE family protein [Flavobacterium microcysteis]
MKKLNKFFLMLFASSLFLASCSSDDSSPNVSLGQYDNGVFVVNEGNSTVTTSSITFISNSGAVEQDVFKNVNPTAAGLGTYLQPMFFDNTRAFIISGSANKITVVNRYTFEFIATISTNLYNPRFGAVANGKAYVTNSAGWETGADDYLTVIDLSDYSTSTVTIGVWSEKIMEENGKIYIANGYYGSGSSVTVFNPASNTVEATIPIGFSPNSFEEENGILYVLGSEKLAKINLATNIVVGTPITVAESTSAGAKNLNIEDNKIYYTVDTAVYAMAINATVAPTAPLLTYQSQSLNGRMYGFAVNDGKIYIADGGDFASDGKAYIYSTTGSLIRPITVGVGPNGFYFN